MPYKDQAKQREYLRAWTAARRAAWFAGKSCVDCGATEGLELDHVYPASKESHKVWSWSRERLEAELAKCVVRCSACHTERHAAERRRHGIGGYQRRKCRCEVCRAAKYASILRAKERQAA